MELLVNKSLYQEKTSLTIKSSDGQSFQLEISAAQNSRYLVSEMEKNPNENEFFIAEVESKILKKVLEYLTYYKDKTPKEIERPLTDYHLDKILDKFDLEYITSFALSDCVDLLNAAEYLEIDSLVKLMCARIASKMMESPIEEVRKTFGIECDMTEEERMKFSKYNLQE